MTQESNSNIGDASVLGARPASSVFQQPERPWHEQLEMSSPIGRRHRFAYRVLGKLYAYFFRVDRA